MEEYPNFPWSNQVSLAQLEQPLNLKVALEQAVE